MTALGRARLPEAPGRLLIGVKVLLESSQQSGLQSPGCTKLIFFSKLNFDETFWNRKVSHGTDSKVKVSLHKLFWDLRDGHRESIAAF